MNSAIATIGGGCFWCLESVYLELNGVIRVEPGYAGGMVENPTYEQVCTGLTGHAEVIQITYDTSELSFAEILTVFFRIHDPTTLNRQGNDVGTQYRSVIFYHDEEQKSISEIAIQAAGDSKIWEDPIVTEITAINNYTTAENYHHNYLELNPGNPYCIAVVGPKVQKFKKLFSEKVKTVD